MDTPPPLPETPAPEITRKVKSKWKMVFWVIPVAPFAIISLCAALGLVKQMKVPTGAMKPNLPPGTHLMAEKCSLWFSEPRRGDILVFTTKDIELIRRSAPGPQLYIKRLIGLPGDTISVNHGVLLVNNKPFTVPGPDGKPLEYTAEGSLKGGKTITVPQGNFFMMGDNSANSYDSRIWGPLPEDAVLYRYWFTYFVDKSVERKRREREQRIR